LIIICILLARTGEDGIAFPKSGFGHFFVKQHEGRKEQNCIRNITTSTTMMMMMMTMMMMMMTMMSSL
tara:strand:+ start:5582 stop:5785 length:204 start_codon:yes stop_codon:yes gene_type:complete